MMSTPPWSDMTTRDLDESRKTAATLPNYIKQVDKIQHELAAEKTDSI